MSGAATNAAVGAAAGAKWLSHGLTFSSEELPMTQTRGGPDRLVVSSSFKVTFPFPVDHTVAHAT